MEKDLIKVFKVEEVQAEEVYKGDRRRRLAAGKNMTLNMYEQDPGAITPEHSHPQELMAVVLKGKVEVQFNGKKYVLGPGEGYHIPGNVMHGPFTVVGDETVVYIDVLSPPREIEEYAGKKK